ncbi:hypothetical protein RKD18_008203 [Streptomyces phaeoluteigriseus]
MPGMWKSRRTASASSLRTFGPPLSPLVSCTRLEEPSRRCRPPLVMPERYPGHPESGMPVPDPIVESVHETKRLTAAPDAGLHRQRILGSLVIASGGARTGGP